MTKQVVSVNEFVTAPGAEFDWIVPGRVAKPAMTLVAGPPKSGKSYLMVDIANRIASGGDVFGVQSRPSKVLYLTTDAREAVWRMFFQELMDAGVKFHPNFQLVASNHWHRPANILTDATYEWTKNLLDECNPDVVVLDVLRDFHNGDENDSTAMKMVFDRLEKLFKHVCLFLVHHSKKLPDDVVDPNPRNYIRGSSYMMGKVDDLWFLVSKDGSPTGTLKIDGRMGGAALKFTGRRLDSGLWEFPQTEVIKTKAQMCVALCDEFPGRKHGELADIAMERYKIGRSTYFKYVKLMPCAHTKDLASETDLTLREMFGTLVWVDHNPALEVETEYVPDIEAAVCVVPEAVHPEEGWAAILSW